MFPCWPSIFDALSDQLGQTRTLWSRDGSAAAHSWPGNLAELRDVVNRSALRSRGQTIELCDVEAGAAAAARKVVPLEQLSLEETLRN